ncbi:MAG: DUF1801 domain-containing protein [Bacteroidota bacterium]
MSALNIKQHPEIAQKFSNYAPHIHQKLLHLRQLILDTAEEQSITNLEETLKWGEPSYIAKKGSTIRIDWKAKSPEQYAMYFKYTSKLVPTFKAVYGDLFRYEKTRAIVFGLDDEVPEMALKECIAVALRYHLLKEKPLLGAMNE